VASDGARADDERFGDLGVALSGGDESQHVDLARGETCGVGGTATARAWAQLFPAGAGVGEVALRAVLLEESRRGVEMVDCLSVFAAVDGDLGETLVVASRLDRAALLFAPLEAGLEVSLSLVELAEPEREKADELVGVAGRERA